MSELSNVSIVTFELEPKSQYTKYGIEVDWSGPPQILVIDPEPDEDISMSESDRFYHQMATNHAMLGALRNMSANHVPYLDPERCQKFWEISWGYDDVHSLDRSVSEELQQMQPISVVVVTHNGQYAGHIYVWIAPTDPTLCLMIGIRNRVDNVFIRGYPDYLPNVSLYLLDGCREFALRHGATRLAVVYPLHVMVSILTRLGFQQERLTNADISLSPLSPRPIDKHSTGTLDAYYNDNLDIPFI